MALFGVTSGCIVIVVTRYRRVFFCEAGDYVHPKRHSTASTPLIYRPMTPLSGDSIEPPILAVEQRQRRGVILVAVILLLTSLCYLRMQTLSAWILNSSFHVLTTSITSDRIILIVVIVFGATSYSRAENGI